jgi:hypothetical protein
MTDNFSIDFYNKAEAAVTISWPTDYVPENIKFLDFLFFSCYLIRQMRNLGNHPANQALIQQILLMPLESQNLVSHLDCMINPVVSYASHIMLYAAILIDMDPYRAKEKYGQEIHLVPFHGNGKKRFTGSLIIINQNRPLFFLNVLGFGIRGIIGWDIPLYATDSIFHIISFLCKKNLTDLNYRRALVKIAQNCVQAYQNNVVTSSNQELVAQTIVENNLNL